jgi:hypothetical protein
VAILENGPYANGKWLAALVALIDALAGGLTFELPYALHSAALGAYRTLGPYAILNKPERGGFVVKVRG